MNSASRARWPRVARITLAALCCLVAVSVAAYLWSRGGSGVAGCDAISGADCDAALSSRWSKVIGVPVSLLGGLCYLGLLGAVTMIAFRLAAGWRIAELLIPAALGGAAWFVGLQITGASPLCPYCLTIHTAGVLASTMLLAERFSSRKSAPSPANLASATIGLPKTSSGVRSSAAASAPPLGALTFLGTIGVVALIGTQLVLPPEIIEIDASEFSLASAEVGISDVENGSNARGEPARSDADQSGPNEGGSVEAETPDPPLTKTDPVAQPPVNQPSVDTDQIAKEPTGEPSNKEKPVSDPNKQPVAERPVVQTLAEVASEQVAPEQPAANRSEQDTSPIDTAVPSTAKTSPTADQTSASIDASLLAQAAPAKTPSTERRAGQQPSRRSSGSRKVSLLKGKLIVDTYKYPVLGSPEAPNVVLEMMSYSCSHCREFAKMLDQALPRYGDQLAVIVVPIPTELLCNKYIKKVYPGSRGACRLTRVSLALAHASPEQFSEFHHWLLATKKLRGWNYALAKAREMTGSNKVEERFISQANKKQLQEYIEFYGALSRAGATTLPTQVIGDIVAPGKPASVNQLCRVWEKHLDLRQVGSN